MPILRINGCHRTKGLAKERCNLLMVEWWGFRRPVLPRNNELRAHEHRGCNVTRLLELQPLSALSLQMINLHVANPWQDWDITRILMNSFSV